MENIQSSSKSQKIKLDFKDSKYATGRRKTSIARVWVKKGTGKIFVNGKTMDDYFTSDNHKMQIVRPFEIINQSTSYDVRCSVKGGGPTGQAGAMVHGISKALVLFDETLKATLKTEKLTTRDSRAVERKNLVEEKPEEASSSLKDNLNSNLYKFMPKLNVLVAGSTGYIGVQLVKLLLNHKKVNIKYLCGSSSVGKKISFYDKSLDKKKLPKIIKYHNELLKDVDLIFTALPNGQSQNISKNLYRHNTLIDLSADFRLDKASDYLKWYKQNMLFLQI